MPAVRGGDPESSWILVFAINVIARSIPYQAPSVWFMRNDVSPPSADLDKLLSWPQVRPMIGDQGRTTWWRAIRRGEAPTPVRVSPGRVAWRASDILAWQVARQRAA